MHAEFIERTRAAVARAHLADDLQLQVGHLQRQLAETEQREQQAKEKLHLFLEQFRSQTHTMKESANNALETRHKLEAEAAALRAQTAKQTAEIGKLSAGLEAANVALSRSQSRSSVSMLNSLLESPLSGGSEERSRGSRRNTTKQQQQQQHVDPNSSTVVLLSPPPPTTPSRRAAVAADSSTMNMNNNNNSTSVAFSQQSSSSNLLQSRRMKKLINASYGNDVSAAAAADDGGIHPASPSSPHHHIPRLNLYERQQCSARLAARISLACFPTRVMVERCAPLPRLATEMQQQQQNQQIVAFRVGQLVSGWWKFSVTSVQLPTTATNIINQSSSSSSSSAVAGGKDTAAPSPHLAAAHLPVGVSSSLAMRRPPRGTRADFGSLLECQAEAALFSTAQEQFHRATSSSSSQQQQYHHHPSALSSVEFLASWVGLRPKHLRPVSLTTQHELETVLDILLSTSGSGGGDPSSSSSVLYLTNQFSRRECFIVDSSRIGRERLCCCVAVAGLGMLGSCVVESASASPKSSKRRHAFQQQQIQLPLLEAAWLSLDEVRENFSTCICISPSLFNEASTSSNNRSLSALLRSQPVSQFLMSSSSSSSSVAPTEIRFSCLLDERGSCADAGVRLLLRGVNTAAAAAASASAASVPLEKIDEWVGRFSVDFYVNDVALPVSGGAGDEQQQQQQQEESSIRSLRTDIACDGVIRWSFSKEETAATEEDVGAKEQDKKQKQNSAAAVSSPQSKTPSKTPTSPRSPPRAAAAAKSDSNSSSTTKPTNSIVMRFSCADQNAVARAIAPGMRVCSAVCVLHVPPPPPPPGPSASSASSSSSSSSPASFCIPGKTVITLCAASEDDKNSSNGTSTTFQVNAETLPSASGTLSLVCGDTSRWHLAGGGGVAGALLTRSHAATPNRAGVGDNSSSSSSDLSPRSMRARAYEVFGIGISAAEAWLSTAGSWLTRFNTFKAILLVDSCRAVEQQHTSSALRHSSPAARVRPPPGSSSSTSFASPSTVYLAHALSNSNSNNAKESSSVAARQNMFVQFVLVCRFAEWMQETTELFAWQFDALVSLFHSASAGVRWTTFSATSSSCVAAAGASRGGFDATVSRSIFTSPVAADGGDEFLLSTPRGMMRQPQEQQQQQHQQQQQWNHLCTWQREYARQRMDLLFNWGDCIALESAVEFSGGIAKSAASSQQQQQPSSSQYVTRGKSPSASRAEHQQQQQHQQNPLQTGALQDRCSALQMECETLALRLDAAEKHNAASADRASSLQQRLDDAQRDAQLLATELQRMRSNAESSLHSAIENERFLAQREVAAAKARCGQLEEEVDRKDQLLEKYRHELETQQKERMAKYSEMLKEFGSSLSYQQQQHHDEEDSPSMMSRSSEQLNSFVQQQHEIAANTSTMFSATPSHQALLEQQRKFREMMEGLRLEQRAIEVETEGDSVARQRRQRSLEQQQQQHQQQKREPSIGRVVAQSDMMSAAVSQQQQQQRPAAAAAPKRLTEQPLNRIPSSSSTSSAAPAAAASTAASSKPSYTSMGVGSGVGGSGLRPKQQQQLAPSPAAGSNNKRTPSSDSKVFGRLYGEKKPTAATGTPRANSTTITGRPRK